MAIHSSLENPTDRGAWWATVHEIAKSRTRLSDFTFTLENTAGFPAGSDGKESAWNAGDLGSIPGMGRSPGGRPWQPTLVFLPGEFHGQKSLAGYSSWGHKELDMTED